jgi:hypothetical protein
MKTKILILLVVTSTAAFGVTPEQVQYYGQQNNVILEPVARITGTNQFVISGNAIELWNVPNLAKPVKSNLVDQSTAESNSLAVAKTRLQNLDAQDIQTLTILETVRLLNMLNGRTNTVAQVKAAYSAARKAVDKAAR